MTALVAVLLVAADPAAQCNLFRPVAPDEASARRIAEAIIRNVPASGMARDAAAAGRPYELIVQPARDDPGQWEAFQMPQRDRRRLRDGEIELFFAGHGLGFRIDRCTGAISRMAYQR